ncbi:MAG TPA: hypothetical protein VGE24_11925, partial [Emticicia sp.]
EVALLDIETAGTRNFTITFEAPDDAGDALKSISNNTDLWLNWTSIVTDGAGTDPSRAIKVKMNATISGLDVKVQPGALSADGEGTKGTIVGSALTLSTTDQDLVTAIGSCYTGNGSSKGSNLTYSFAPTSGSYGDLKKTATTLTITYTLTDN